MRRVGYEAIERLGVTRYRRSLNGRGRSAALREMSGVPYVICFCTNESRVLLLHRGKPPNRGLWNGVGGKMEPDETPRECVRREVAEETGVRLDAGDFRFAGLVTWDPGVDETMPSVGMYAFVAPVSGEYIFGGERETPEGRLAWKPLTWACDRGNGAVVSNVPRFLPGMLDGGEPKTYRCQYGPEGFVSVTADVLKDEMRGI